MSWWPKRAGGYGGSMSSDKSMAADRHDIMVDLLVKEPFHFLPAGDVEP